jgi:hypothetical protein
MVDAHLNHQKHTIMVGKLFKSITVVMIFVFICQQAGWAELYYIRPMAAKEKSFEWEKYLRNNAYPGGPIAMIDDIYDSGANLVIITDQHTTYSKIKEYRDFIELVVEHIAKKGVRLLLIEENDEVIQKDVCPRIREWMNSDFKEFDDWLSSHGSRIEKKFFRNSPRQWLYAIRAALKQGMVVVGYDPRGSYNIYGQPLVGEIPMEVLVD